MILRINRNPIARWRVMHRLLSSFEFVNVTDTKKGYQIVEMNRPPVNSFNLKLMGELITAVDNAEKSPDIRGLIVTSKHKAFGAGLDLVEMCNSDIDHLRLFWSSFQELHLRLYASPLVTIAAINGHAVAGASALTLVCDYRIMADGKFKIGLPTVHTGILVPLWLSKLFKLTVGVKEAERYLCLGALSTPREALERGLVDCVVPGANLMEESVRVMEEWLKIPNSGRTRTKQLVRQKFIDEFHSGQELDKQEFITMMSDPDFVEHLKSYTGRLKKK